MWCIPKLNDEFRERMEDLLDLYAEPYDPQRPVICLDEKSKQLLGDSRPSLPAGPGKTAVQDYEYVRKGTRNIFVAVEPKGGKRVTEVTGRRTKGDYALFVERVLETYPDAEVVRLVQDNLNTHGIHSLVETFGVRKAKRLWKRVETHPTPKHASWLNMAEIEIGILGKQCLGRRIASAKELSREVQAYTDRRNEERGAITWRFSRERAREVFPALYPVRTL